MKNSSIFRTLSVSYIALGALVLFVSGVSLWSLLQGATILRHTTDTVIPLVREEQRLLSLLSNVRAEIDSVYESSSVSSIKSSRKQIEGIFVDLDQILESKQELPREAVLSALHSLERLSADVAEGKIRLLGLMSEGRQVKRYLTTEIQTVLDALQLMKFQEEERVSVTLIFEVSALLVTVESLSELENRSSIEKYLQRYREQVRTISSALATLPRTDETRAIAHSVRRLSELSLGSDGWSEQLILSYRLKKEISQLRKRIVLEEEVLREHFQLFVDNIRQSAGESVERIERTLSYTFTALVVSLILSLFVLFFVVRSVLQGRIIQRLQRLTQSMRELSKGELDISVVDASSDEIGAAYEALGVFRDNAAELTRQKNFISTVLATIPVGVIGVRPSGEIAFGNDSLCEMFQYTPEDLIGERCEMLIPERYREAHEGYFRDYLRNPVKRALPSSPNLLGLRRDGSLFDVEIGLQPMEAEDLILAVIVDISERRAAERREEEREAELRFIFDNVPARIWFKDDTNRILRLNRAAAESMGGTVSDFEGRDTYDLFPDMAKKYHEDDLQVIESEKPLLGIIEEYAPVDGQAGWVMTDKVPAALSQGGRRSILVVSTDVTDRIRAENNLRLVLDSSPSIIAFFDHHLCYRLVNEPYRKWFGMREDQLIGKHAREVLGLEMFSAIEESMMKAAGGERVDVEVELPRADGVTRWMRVSYIPRSSEVFREPGFVVFATDIHEQKLLSLDLERSNEELSQFAYVASHDLKSPLRSISNYAQWILEDSGDLLPKESHDHLVKLRQRAVKMKALLEDLLAYSRIGRGDEDVVPLETSLFVQEIVDLLENPAGIEISVSHDMPMITAPRVPLDIVFRNLITNAIKYHDKDHGHITVSGRLVESFYEFSVSDDGPGIAENYHEKIFEMFQSLGSQEGTGMGLALVKKTVEMYGGSVWIESEPGAGATFRFTWPVRSS